MVRNLFLAHLLVLLTLVFQPTTLFAQAGWKAEEAIANGNIDARYAGMAVDNKNNEFFSFWDSGFSGTLGGGYSVRPHLGPTTARLGFSNPEYMSMSVDDQGNALVAYINAGSNAVIAGYIPAGSNFVSMSQSIGTTVPYNAGRTVDVHLTKNGLGVIIWLDNTGRPNVAFRGTGDTAQFDLANKSTLDTSPSSSAGNVFVARDTNGGAFAWWRRDNQYKQAYYNPSTGIFDVQNFNLVVPIGPPPTAGKINSGSVLSLELNKNSSGDVAIGYAIYTSQQGISVQPFNSISIVYAYRKNGTPVFGQQIFSKNPDDIEELYTQVGVLPDGRAVVSWIKKVMIPNPCSSGISGPYITDGQELRSVISNANGEDWKPLVNIPVDNKTAFIQFPTEMAVAKDRVVFGFKKSLKSGQCSLSTTAVEFNLIRALWPDGQPAFTGDSAPVTIPGLVGFGNPAPFFDDLGAIGVSDIGTVAVLATKDVSGVDRPSLFVWESGLSPGSGGGSTPGGEATPTGNDLCPSDINKTSPGTCGCGFDEIDSNGDTFIDCGSPGAIYTKGSILSNPPNVQSDGKKLSMIMQIYEQYITGKVPALMVEPATSAAKAKAPKVKAVYEVTAKLQNSKAKCGKVKVESKKNKVVLKNLLNGTYDVSYRIIFMQGDKKIGATKQSPISTGVISSGKTKCPVKKK